jgi:hypothetical protein
MPAKASTGAFALLECGKLTAAIQCTVQAKQFDARSKADRHTQCQHATDHSHVASDAILALDQAP